MKSFLFLIPWATLIWYFARGRKTNSIIFYIYMVYFVVVLLGVLLWVQGL